MTLFGLYRRAKANFLCGICSGIPLCCNVFYTLLWEPWLPWKGLGKAKNWPRVQLWYRKKFHGFGYIPCPVHYLLGKRLKMKRCVPGCWCGLGTYRKNRCTDPSHGR